MNNSCADVTAELLCLKSLGIRELYIDSHESDRLEPEQQLEKIAQTVCECTKCRLAENRNHAVPGEGNPVADLMFIGEEPGREEDRVGRPFVGAAGVLLDKIILAMKLQRNDIFIANIVKCHPPSNRNPQEDECSECIPYLWEQISVIQPSVIVTLGSVAVQRLLETNEGVSSLRGTFRNWNGIQVMPTFHPAYLLRNASAKKEVWSDMKQVMKVLGLS